MNASKIVKEGTHNSLFGGDSILNCRTDKQEAVALGGVAGRSHAGASFVTLKQKTNDETFLKNYNIKEKHAKQHMRGFFEADKQMRRSFAGLIRR